MSRSKSFLAATLALAVAVGCESGSKPTDSENKAQAEPQPAPAPTQAGQKKGRVPQKPGPDYKARIPKPRPDL